MKRLFGLLASIILILPIQAKDKDEIIKTGWNFGPLPVVGFDSDLGFQYGLCCDIFNYGDGSNYPQYNYKINVEASTYTKGSGILRTYGDFKTLIPDGKLFFDVTYFNAPKFGFYGYNGLSQESNLPYQTFIPGTGPDPVTDLPDYYNFMSRKQFRALASVRKTISGNLSAAAGLAYYHISTGSYNLNDDNGLTLYDLYLMNDLIHENEQKGGNVTQLRAGLVYDSRNHDSDPTHGINFEASLVYSPDLIDGNGYSNLGMHLSYSQFISPFSSERLTLAYRALVQTKLWGDIPYYFTNNINSMFFRKLYTEGLGGNASVRGLNRKGVLGDGFAMLNLELRWRIIDFKLINQNWQIATNPFFDAGKVIQPYRLDEQEKAGFTGNAKDMHCTAGLGIKLVMNHNMVVSFEAAKAFDENDGNGLWTNIGFNYLF